MSFIGLKKFNCSVVGNKLHVFAPPVSSVFSGDLDILSDSMPSNFYTFYLDPKLVHIPVYVSVHSEEDVLPYWYVKTGDQTYPDASVKIAELDYDTEESRWVVTQIHTGPIYIELPYSYSKSSTIPVYGTVIDEDHAVLDDGSVVDLEYCEYEIENSIFPKPGDRVILRGC